MTLCPAVPIAIAVAPSVHSLNGTSKIFHARYNRISPQHDHPVSLVELITHVGGTLKTDPKRMEQRGGGGGGASVQGDQSSLCDLLQKALAEAYPDFDRQCCLCFLLRRNRPTIHLRSAFRYLLFLSFSSNLVLLCSSPCSCSCYSSSYSDFFFLFLFVLPDTEAKVLELIEHPGNEGKRWGRKPEDYFTKQEKPNTPLATLVMWMRDSLCGP